MKTDLRHNDFTTTELLKRIRWEIDAAVSSHSPPNRHKGINTKHFEKKVSPGMQIFQERKGVQDRTKSVCAVNLMPGVCWAGKSWSTAPDTVRCETENRQANTFASPNQEHSSRVFQIKNYKRHLLGYSWSPLSEPHDSLIRDFNMILVQMLKLYPVNLIFFHKADEVQQKAAFYWAYYAKNPADP